VPEITRLGRTLKCWSDAFLAYFDTDRSNNGGPEANGVSGTTASRPELNRLLNHPLKGDEVVVWRLDRLGAEHSKPANPNNDA